MRNIKRWFALALAVAVTSGSIAMLPVHAGTITTTIGDESYKKELDNTVWNNPDGDIQIKDDKILFPADSTDATRIISKSSVVRTEQLEELFDAEFTMEIASLPKDEEFVFAMGLSSIESMPKDQGNLEVAFSNSNGLAVQVVEYADADAPKVLIKKTNCGSLSKAKVRIEYSNTGKLTLLVNGKTIGTCKTEMNGEGSVGFLQTGKCKLELSDLKIYMYKYDRPENSNIFEDFESGDFNLSLMSAKTTYSTEYNPSTMKIEDYKGSKVLMFRNVGTGYLVTKQQYSNFELTFDLPYIQAEEEKDEDGNTVTPICDSFGVSFGGGTGGDDPVVNFSEATDLLLYMSNSVMGYLTNTHGKEEPTHKYREPGKEVPVIRVLVKDGEVLTAVKWKSEPDSAYETLLSYKSYSTRTGYVAIWAPSGRSSSFAIDNVRLTNLDKDANIVEVDRTTSKVETPADYNYEPQKQVYRETESKKEGIPTEYLALAALGGVCVLAIIITACVTAGKRRKRGAEDEKKDEA